MPFGAGSVKANHFASTVTGGVEMTMFDCLVNKNVRSAYNSEHLIDATSLSIFLAIGTTRQRRDDLR
ncbi:MAG: hypothetical protein ACI9BW_002501 [Gammaproteobacteria bacterium]